MVGLGFSVENCLCFSVLFKPVHDVKRSFIN
jgi:hypothetical protein